MAKSARGKDARSVFLAEVASTVGYWTDQALKGLTSGGPDPLTSSCQDEYRTLAASLGSEQARLAFSAVVRESLIGLAHSVLVTLDGGSALSEQHTMELIDENGDAINDGLHEDLFRFL